jgi:PAS domain S-box-containing protein
MSPARYPARWHSGWNTWSEEVQRLEKELAQSRAREDKARREVQEAKERFDRLLEASKSFTRTLTSGRQQQRNSRQYLAAQHTVDRVLAEADSLEDAAENVLRTLGENLGWQAALLWVAGKERLRCLAVWHRPDAVPDGFARARLQTTLMRGERLPGMAVEINRPVWEGAPDSFEPTSGLRGALVFPISESVGASGAIELLGGRVEVPDRELLHTVRLIGSRLGQFAERNRSGVELRDAEERLRLATEAGHVGMLDWNVSTGKSRCSGALARIFGLPLEGATLTYDDLLARVHHDDRERVRDTFDSSISDATPYDLEFRITAPDGVRWIHLKGRVHTNEAGEATRVHGIMLGITEVKQAEQENERLRSLEARVHVEAAERDRISRELHDRVAHSMGVAYQNLQLYEALAEKDPERAHNKLHTAKEMSKLALEQTRNLSMELRRSETENGLVPALQDLLEVAVPDDISANLSASGAESLLPDHQRGQLYVILREAVRNAVRHSGCRHLTVGVDITPEEVSGYVEDDGRGFGRNGDGENGLGLRSIKERAALLHGTARVYSSPQGGAGVRVLLPLQGGRGVGWKTRE